MKFQTDLDDGNIPNALRREFGNNGITFSEDITVLIEAPDSTWRIWDNVNKLAEFTIRKEGDKLNIYGAIPPTAVRRPKTIRQTTSPITHRVYTVDTDEDAIAIWDKEAKTKLGQFKVGPSPMAIAFDPKSVRYMSLIQEETSPF